MGKRATSFYRQPLSVFCESVSLDWIVKKREKQKKKRGIDAFVADGNFHWLILPCWRYGVLALMCNMCQVTIIFFSLSLTLRFWNVFWFLVHHSKISTACVQDTHRSMVMPWWPHFTKNLTDKWSTSCQLASKAHTKNVKKNIPKNLKYT